MGMSDTKKIDDNEAGSIWMGWRRIRKFRVRYSVERKQWTRDKGDAKASPRGRGKRIADDEYIGKYVMNVVCV